MAARGERVQVCYCLLEIAAVESGIEDWQGSVCRILLIGEDPYGTKKYDMGILD